MILSLNIISHGPVECQFAEIVAKGRQPRLANGALVSAILLGPLRLLYKAEREDCEQTWKQTLLAMIQALSYHQSRPDCTSQGCFPIIPSYTTTPVLHRRF